MPEEPGNWLNCFIFTLAALSCHCSFRDQGELQIWADLPVNFIAHDLWPSPNHYFPVLSSDYDFSQLCFIVFILPEGY